ncbi:MAG: apolipoprotein N-acyltransferase [Pseudomonadota bacterium]|nr:apolipoprotein N-acyltransferase [Pseudomonadales bacterium]MDY6919046.1 apolipoprotein N-acyltransferase [Pseudomonadota bacterium]
MTLKHSITSGGKGHLLALLAGAVYPLGLAPLKLWPLIPLSLALLLLVLAGQSPRRAAWRGFLYGMGFNGVGVSWVYVSIHFYGNTPAWLAALGTVLFCAFLSAVFFALPFWGYQKLRLERYPLLTFPALWVLLEWSKTWFLSGFPWLWAGYGLLDTPAAGLAPVAGALGLSLMVAVSAVLLYWIGQREFAHRLPAAIGLAVLWAGCWSLNSLSWTLPDLAQTREVVLVQGNIPQEQKWDPNYRRPIMDTYLSATRDNWDADLILWPEAAYPVFYHQALSTITALDLEAEQRDVAVISGVPRWEPGDRGEDYYYNAVFVIGAGQGFYNKQKLVPFGEYVPLEDVLRGLLPFFNLPMSSFTAGAPEQPELVAKGLSFATYICYEIVYPELVRRQARGKDFLITISNDAWFGRSWGPLQHFQMARMRALETGKYLLRGTNTGITAIIDQRGRVQSMLPQFQRGVLKGTLYGTQGVTPFVRFGQWPVLGLSLISLLVGIGLSLRPVPEQRVRPLYHRD